MYPSNLHVYMSCVAYRYVYKLSELHERDSNFTEAALTLLLHAQTLEVHVYSTRIATTTCKVDTFSNCMCNVLSCTVKFIAILLCNKDMCVAKLIMHSCIYMYIM